MLGALTQIDSAGFAAIDANLNGDAPEIAAAWLGKVERAGLAAQAVMWPDSMKAAVDGFVKAAGDLAAALGADDAAKAAPLAKAAAEAQAALSQATYAAVAGMAGSSEGAGATLGALGVINLAGIGSMETALAADGAEINPAWESRVANARVAALALVWPGESQAAADAFVTAATALEAAVKANDVAAAKEAAVAANKARGTLATRGYGALSGMRQTADSNGAALAALAAVDTAAFHGIDEGLNGDKPEIQAAWAGRVTTAKRAIQTIRWSAEVQTAADAFSKTISALEAQLTAKEPDLAKAGEAAAAAHEAQHTFSEIAYAAIGGKVAAH
ncbi:MAG: hypothetical protein CVU47_00825 [Chloroflexi bacterium HGW-Chloroflexi-9]|nr:MAG: hypothetical protein CVU47_00825 [Chloroflexi bacterium HGW-Chloroflexi-9]